MELQTSQTLYGILPLYRIHFISTFVYSFTFVTINTLVTAGLLINLTLVFFFFKYVNAILFYNWISWFGLLSALSLVV